MYEEECTSGDVKAEYLKRRDDLGHPRLLGGNIGIRDGDVGN